MTMDYASLIGTKGATGSIKTWVNSDVIEPATMVDEAADMIFQGLRHWQMISTHVGTIAAGATSFDVTSRFRETVSLEFTSPVNQKLTPQAPFQIEQQRYYVTTSGAIGTNLPSVYAIKGTQVEFPSAMDRAYVFRHVFFRDPPPLSTASGSTTNFVTATYPRMMRAACMAQSFEFLRKQDEKLYWMAIMEARISEANAEAAMATPGADQGWPSNFWSDG